MLFVEHMRLTKVKRVEQLRPREGVAAFRRKGRVPVPRRGLVLEHEEGERRGLARGRATPGEIDRYVWMRPRAPLTTFLL